MILNVSEEKGEVMSKIAEGRHTQLILRETPENFE